MPSLRDVGMSKFPLFLFSRNPRFFRLSVCAAVCLLCAWAIAALKESHEEPAGPKKVVVDFTPVRGELHALRLHREDFTYKCSECHRTTETLAGRERVVAEGASLLKTDENLDDFAPMPKNRWSKDFPHASLKLNLSHGRNDQCFNCHNKEDRNTYITHDGSAISAEESEQLCAKCHGLTVRDWLQGAHGRRSGYWDEGKGAYKDLTCIQCHNPHAPLFAPLKPLPGPTTSHHIPEKELH